MLEKLKRFFWLALGHFFLVIAVVGAIFSVLLTVLFVILASACYARGSKKIHQILRGNRWLGSVIKDWEDKRAISLKYKYFAVGILLISVSFAIIFLSSFWIKIGAIIIAIGVAWFIVTRTTAK